MATLGFVIYPETTLVNANHVQAGDEMLYGYGAKYYSAYPDGAKVLVKFDGTKDATEGFIVAISEEQQEAADKYRCV